MNGKSSNNLQVTQETVNRSLDSIDGTFLGIDDRHPSDGLHELEK
jgi:hypothetical protein